MSQGGNHLLDLSAATSDVATHDTGDSTHLGEAHFPKGCFESFLPGMIAQAAPMAGPSNRFSFPLVREVITYLVRQVFSIVVADDLFPNFEKLFQFLHVFHHVKAAAHGYLEIPQANLHNAFSGPMRFPAG